MPRVAKSSVYPEYCVTKLDRRAFDAGYRFDESRAERVRTFFARFLRHSKGEWAGKPFALLDWQWRDVLAPLFGWVDGDGLRRYRRAGVWIPKKNGKSTLAAGIELFMMLADREPGAECYVAAADREQAGIVYREAASMVTASDDLTAVVENIESRKRLVHRGSNSFLQALSADVPTKEGLNWHLLVFDELHAQRSRELWDTLAYGGIARRQPLLLSISTAGYDRTTIGYEQFEYAQSVLAGTVEDLTFFAYIRGAGQRDDWRAPRTWRKANPSLGVTIRESELAAACREAEASPQKENAFRRYRLNQWTQQAQRVLSVEKWQSMKRNLPSLDGRPCWAGLDIGSTSDMTALAILFPLDDSDTWAGKSGGAGAYALRVHGWVPSAALDKRGTAMASSYREWSRRGWLTITDGDVTDYDVVRRDIAGFAQRYAVQELAVDRLFQGAQLSTQLQGDGLNVITFGQGFLSMAAPTRQFLELVVAGRIYHDGNKLIEWMAGNLAVEQDAAGNYKPSKRKSMEKIDGIVATIMALGRATSGGGARSVYDTPGQLTL